MTTKKRAEHKPGHQYIVIDAVKYVGSVDYQFAANPHSQDPVLLPYVVDDNFLLQPLPLPRHEGPGPGTDALAVLPAFVGDICIDFPSTAGAPHVPSGKPRVCISAAGRRVTAIQAR